MKRSPLSQQHRTGLLTLILGAFLALSARAQAPATPIVFDSVYTTTPVRLVYFTAFLYHKSGQIEWTTMGEGDSQVFDIEQSTDGHVWQYLSSMQAHPGYTERYGYVFIDGNISRYGVPVVYYRLHLLAQNGRSTYSPVRRIWLNIDAAAPLR